jgi:3-oxoacyl-[acyl-carrier-protein] synthase II
VRPVAITGMGILSPIGCDPESCFEFLAAGRSALSVPQDPQLVDMNVIGVGSVRGADPEGLDRVEDFAVRAVRAALADAGLQASDVPADAVVCVSTSKGPMATLEATLRGQATPPIPLHRLSPCSAAETVATEIGFRGAVLARTAACATGLVSVLSATSDVACGRASMAIAGASEASLTPLMHAGFASLGALARETGSPPQELVRPFDRSRCGFLLAEGAAVFVIEPLEAVSRRGGRARSVVAGWAEQCDAFDLVKPSAGGESELRAAQLALERAGLQPADLDGVWLHGTATLSGDQAELRALGTLCPPSSPLLPATASKGATGHLLGASGAVELALAAVCREKHYLPAVRNLAAPLDSGSLQLLRGQGIRTDGGAYLVLSAGFGGSCAAAVLTEPTS